MRPIDAAYRFNPNTRNLSSQSLTESISLSNTSSIGSYSSSTGISSESLLASTDNNSSLDSFDSTASSFRDRDQDNFTGINTFSENSQF